MVVKRDLVAANRAPVRRVERKYDPPASQFAERQILVGRDAESEIGRHSSRCQKLGHDVLPLMQRRPNMETGARGRLDACQESFCSAAELGQLMAVKVWHSALCMLTALAACESKPGLERD